MIENPFKTEINYIKDENIRKNASILVSMLPTYFYEIPASSTGKYHPKYTTGNYGLYKHVKAAVRIAVELLNLEMYQKIFNDEQKDLIILSLILHDGFKCGIEKEKYTRFDHPLIMANFIKDNQDKLTLSEKQIKILINNISKHMGQWTTDYNGNEVLEKPSSSSEKFVHLCDYLASRKFLNVEFDNSFEIID